MGARHIDDKIPGEAARMKSMKKAADERAARISYWQCRDCHHDFKIYKSTKVPDDHTCKPCQTKRRNKEIVYECRYCGEDFSIDRDYLGFDPKKPVCDECQYALDSRERDEDEEEEEVGCLMCGREVGVFEPVCKTCYNGCLEGSKGMKPVEL
jgi:hypothetical protein